MSRVCGCGAAIQARSKTCTACYRKATAANPAGDDTPYVPTLPRDYDEAMAGWDKLIGRTSRKYKGPAKRRKGKTEKIVVCSDFHAPFQHTEALMAMIERERGADVCIVGGDLQDHFSISRFLKYESVPIAQELAAAQMIMEKLSEAFPVVLCVEGNHDTSRFEKLLADRLPHDAIDIIRHLSISGTLSTVEVLCRQFSNVEHVKNTVGGRFGASWFVQRGDLIVSHAEKFSIVPGSALRKVEEWFSDFEEACDLKPWRVIVQAHTHQLSMFPWRADKLLLEGGCMCTPHGYQFAARIGGRPQRVGWVTMVQHDGVTDFSTVQPYWWEKAQ